MSPPERIAVPDRTRFLERHEHRLLRVAALVGLVVLWEIVTRAGWVRPLFLPAPSAVLEELVDMARSGLLWTHLWASVRRLLWGFG
ncbi:MAG TPA: ABC transporter permease, partial [Verrucomicrobiae bacterium]|nr:ABC transporter permease [Verrucomicrobiae bacterium]